MNCAWNSIILLLMSLHQISASSQLRFSVTVCTVHFLILGTKQDTESGDGYEPLTREEIKAQARRRGEHKTKGKVICRLITTQLAA